MDAFKAAMDEVRVEGSCDLRVPVEENHTIPVTGRRGDGVISLTVASDTGEPAVMLDVYEPASARLPDYPADLPFAPLAEAAVTRIAGEDGRSVVWKTEETGGGVANVIVQSETSGWDRVERERLPVELVKGDLTRMVVAMPFGPLADKVTLFETKRSS